MAAIDVNFPITTKVLFNLEDLGIKEKFISDDCVTMQSGKYICVRETNSVVIIDMTQPKQPLRLDITADSAIMNPDTPILAFKVQAKIDETTSQDQLQMYDINTKTTLKSCNITEKVEYLKWISPKLLGLVTLKTVYRWSTQDSTGPEKMFDITDLVATSKITKIRNYMLDPSEKWVVLMGYKREDNRSFHPIFVRPYQGGDQWFRFKGHAAAFITFNVGGNVAPSILLCSVYGQFRPDDTRFIELSISDELGSQQGEPNFKKKNLEYNIAGTNAYVEAMQISKKYGLIYVIIKRGLISIHDLETTEAICSCNIVDHITDDNQIILTTEGPTSESFYAINWKGQVLLNSFNGWTILSSINEKLLTREKSHNLRKLCQKILKEKEETVTNLEKSLEAEIRKKEETEELLARVLVETEGLKTQNAQLQNEKDNITSLHKSVQEENTKLRQETEEQLTSMRTQLNNFLNETLNKIDDLKNENAKLKDERDNIVKHMEESLQTEIKARREFEEQLAEEMIVLSDYQKSQEVMMNTIEGLKMQNTELIKDRDKFMRNLEGFRPLVESNDLVENFSEFTEAQLKQATNNFNDSHKILEGEHGSVYKAFLGLKPVAIKILRHESHDGGIKFNQEVSISSKLRHPNLVMLLGACTEKQALIYELMSNGSLHDILRNQSIVLTWKTRIHIASDICSGLICLHSAKPHSIVHGNLKSTNILLDSNYTAKLSDFSTCGHLQPKDTIDMPHHFTIYPKGALPYIDPEYFSTNELTTQSDVYSFGIVLLELVSGRDPMGLRKSVKDALRKGEHFVDATAGEWPSEEAKRMVLLGVRCSDPSAENRPDLVNEVLVEIESMRLASLRF